MSYSEYQNKRKKLLADLRKLGVNRPADHYPQLSIDSADWESQLYAMSQSIGEKQDRSNQHKENEQ